MKSAGPKVQASKAKTFPSYQGKTAVKSTFEDALSNTQYGGNLNPDIQNGSPATNNGYFFNSYPQTYQGGQTGDFSQTQQLTNSFVSTTFNSNYYPQYSGSTSPQQQTQSYMSTFQNGGQTVNTMFQNTPTAYEWSYYNRLEPTNTYQDVKLPKSKQPQVQKQTFNKKDTTAVGNISESILKNEATGQEKTVSIKVPSNVSLKNVLKNIYEQMYQTYFNKRPEQNGVESSEAKKLIEGLVQRDMTNLPSIVLKPSTHAQKNRPQVVKESTKKIGDFIQKMYQQKQVKDADYLQQQHNIAATTRTRQAVTPITNIQPSVQQHDTAATSRLQQITTLNTQPKVQQKGLCKNISTYLKFLTSDLDLEDTI